MFSLFLQTSFSKRRTIGNINHLGRNTTKYFSNKEPENCDRVYVANGVEDIAAVAKRYGTTVEEIRKKNSIGLSFLPYGQIVIIPTDCETVKADDNIYQDNQYFNNSELRFINRQGSSFLSFCYMNHDCRNELDEIKEYSLKANNKGIIKQNGEVVFFNEALKLYKLKQISADEVEFKKNFYLLKKHTLKTARGESHYHWTVYSYGNKRVYDPLKDFIASNTDRIIKIDEWRIRYDDD